MPDSHSLSGRPRALQETSTGPALVGRDDSTTIPLMEESVHVDKRTVSHGGYRITKHVSARQETLDELLRDQQVVIERRPVGLLLEGIDFPQQRYEGDVLIIPVVEEILVTEKRLFLVEEVRVTRTESTHRTPQQVTLRKEEISIERLEPDDASGSKPL